MAANTGAVCDRHSSHLRDRGTVGARRTGDNVRAGLSSEPLGLQPTGYRFELGFPGRFDLLREWAAILCDLALGLLIVGAMVAWVAKSYGSSVDTDQPLGLVSSGTGRR